MSRKRFNQFKTLIREDRYKIRQPLIEILGQNRVLIENYQCIVDYKPTRVEVKVCYGSVCICGKNLILRYMSCDRLVVFGCIDSVLLCGGNGR